MRRSGFTLVELLLVLALLVVGAALASVGLAAGEERVQLEQAAEKVRLAWAEARIEAMESGRPRVFRCRVGGAWGYVGDGDDPAVAAGDDPRVDQAEASSEINFSEGDARVVFRRLRVADQPGEPPLGQAVSEGDLSAMVVFYPDGSTSEAELELSSESGRSLVVVLRGLTGATRVVDQAETAEARP